jgi:Methyltransferase domain
MLNKFASLRSVAARLRNRLYGVYFRRAGKRWGQNPMPHFFPATREVAEKGPLSRYFDQHREGPGIWKWTHYFPIYERHFSRFVGKPVRILEIGVYSGGSLGMWKHYFGEQCHIIGLDIEPACRAYAEDGVQIEIGDQSDRSFWRRIRETVEPVDIIIDDGGHLAQQQRVTLEEMLSHLKPGGVYFCEDITGETNPYHPYLHAMSLAMHATDWQGAVGIKPNPLQANIASIHTYPFVCVIERHINPCEVIKTEKRGTEWQPFFQSSTNPEVAEKGLPPKN